MTKAEVIASRIKELAEERGSTVNKSLKACGINTSLVADMRRRGTIPSAETLSKLAEYFSVSLSYLYGTDVMFKDCGRSVKAERLKQGKTLPEMSKYLSIPEKELSDYENDMVEMPEYIFESISKYFGYPLRTFIDKYNLSGEVPDAFFNLADEREKLLDSSKCNFDINMNSYATIKGAVPVFGTIRAGMPILAQECITGYEFADVSHPEEYFYLHVTGDSMINAGISDGSKVLIHKQNYAENGQIVACLVNGDEATLKRFKQVGDTVVLLPENPKYDPIIVPCSEFDTGYAMVLGVAKKVLTDL